MLTNFHVIDHANFVYVFVPSGGRKPYEAKIKGYCAEQDVALLQLTEESLNELTTLLGSIPYLALGDSDNLEKAESIMALGYPLGSRYSKSTIGEIAGYEYIQGSSYIHMTAPINPGNSGGPLMNRFGEVVGINSAGIPGSQNVCFIIPINDVSSILPQLYEIPLYRKPRLDFRLNPTTKEHAEYLKCPGGSFIYKVLPDSEADKMGVKEGDMLNQIIWRGITYDIDEYGDVKVDWRMPDKISLRELMIRFRINDPIDLIIYRAGKQLKLSTILTEATKYPARYICYNHEPEEMDYEVLFGTVFMQLRQNHIKEFAEAESDKYKQASVMERYKSYLLDPSKEAIIITHVHNGSELQKLQWANPGDILDEINDKKVKNLKELRAAFLESVKTGYIIICTKDGFKTVLSLDKALADEPHLSSEFGYPLTDLYKKLKTLRSSCR